MAGHLQTVPQPRRRQLSGIGQLPQIAAGLNSNGIALEGNYTSDSRKVVRQGVRSFVDGKNRKITAISVIRQLAAEPA